MELKPDVFLVAADTEIKFMTDGVLLKEVEQVRGNCEGVLMTVAR